jgi:alkyl hydroperoxide reductase subunit F
MEIMDNFYELIILGAGPAGTAAGVYASRKKIKTLLIAESFGGQATVAAKIENIIGYTDLSGVQMAQAFEKQLRANQVEMVSDTITSIKKEADIFQVATANSGFFKTKNILIALGRKYKNLEVPGEEKFKGRGVVYCSTCDAPLFKDKPVAVVGAGNAGLLSVIDLSPYASKIYLLTKNENLKADEVLQDKVKNIPKAEIILNAKITEIEGDAMVEALKYQDAKTGEIKRLVVNGVFVQIGMKPNIEPVKDLIQINKTGEIIAEPLTGRTSAPGIWAAGDITDLPYKQISVAVGDGIRALLDIYAELRGIKLKEFI